MNYNAVREVLSGCHELAGLDQRTLALLFWRGQERILPHGATIYAEGAPLDNTFGLLLFGELVVERKGEVVGHIAGQQLFGEMAYFTEGKRRTASVRVDSPNGGLLQFSLTPEELADATLSPLRQCLGFRAWQRFVTDSQRTG